MVPEAREEVEIDAPEEETGGRPPAPPANPIPPSLPKQGQTSLQAVTGKNLDVRSLGTCHTCMDVAADFCSKCAAKAVVKVIAKTVTKADVVGKAVTKADAVDKTRPGTTRSLPGSQRPLAFPWVGPASGTTISVGS